MASIQYSDKIYWYTTPNAVKSHKVVGTRVEFEPRLARSNQKRISMRKLWIKFKSVDLFKWTPAHLFLSLSLSMSSFLYFILFFFQHFNQLTYILFFDNVTRKSKPHSKRPRAPNMDFVQWMERVLGCFWRVGACIWWCPLAYNAQKHQPFSFLRLILISHSFFLTLLGVQRVLYKFFSLPVSVAISIQFTLCLCATLALCCWVWDVFFIVKSESHVNYLMSSAMHSYV